MRCECDLCGGSKPQRKPTKRDVFLACATGLVIGASLALWVPNAHADERDETCRSLGALAQTVAEYRDAGGQSSDVLRVVTQVRGGTGEDRAIVAAVVRWVYTHPGTPPKSANTAYWSACQRL